MAEIRSQAEKTESRVLGDIPKIGTFYLAELGKVRIIPKVRKMQKNPIAFLAGKAYNH